MSNQTTPSMTALQRCKNEHEVYDAVWQKALDMDMGYELQNAGGDMETIADTLTRKTKECYDTLKTAKSKLKAEDYSYMHGEYAQLSHMAREAVERIRELRSSEPKAKE